MSVSGELLSKGTKLEAELKQNSICKHLKKLEKFEASSRIKGLAQNTSMLMERLSWAALDFPLGLQSSGLALHRSRCLTTQEGSLAPSPGLPPSPAGPLAWQPTAGMCGTVHLRRDAHVAPGPDPARS